ncbi:MAG: hypothetical protein ACO3E4_06610 [Candidatus Nanopelagicaceae bacterium]
MNEKAMFEPICWLIQQYDFVSEQTLRCIVLKEPPEGLGGEVIPIHFLPQEFLEVLSNKKD